MSRINEYRTWLREHTDWKALIRRDSGLPGPRGNLELLAAVVEEGGERDFLEYLELIDDSLDGDSPDVLVAACGVAGLGKLIARNQAGRQKHLPRLRALASDPRWRIREAVAMALQRWGRSDMPALLAEMRLWSRGGLLERRAAVAGLCEPDLLADPAAAEQVLGILDEITASTAAAPAGAAEERRPEDFKALSKGLSYGWSVAVAAHPQAGKPYLEKWAGSPDPDVRRIVRENLKKNRLVRMDEAWTRVLLERLEAAER